MAMDTLREYLDVAGFDWDNGMIIVHLPRNPEDPDYYVSSPGWMDDRDIAERKYIEQDDPILDKEFDGGYGAPECPRFVADDGRKIYFPYQYDGLTGVVSVYKDIDVYLTKQSPYPGG